MTSVGLVGLSNFREGGKERNLRVFVFALGDFSLLSLLAFGGTGGGRNFLWLMV